MDTRNLTKLSRRKFIGLISSFSLISSLVPANYVFSLSDIEKKKSLISSNLKDHEFKFFHPYQATVIEEITALIIPTDDGPGAKEAGVVIELDNSIAERKSLQLLYKKGIKWLDYMAGKRFDKKSFLDLSQEHMMTILNLADPRRASSSKGSISIRNRKMLAGILFFDNLVRRTLDIFYTSDQGWEVVGYEGPPQWKGNLGYSKCNVKS